MNLVYLPDSGLYINPAHILYIRRTVNEDSLTIKFSCNQPNLIISMTDLEVITNVRDEF
jgi:hypothetical protein